MTITELKQEIEKAKKGCWYDWTIVSKGSKDIKIVCGEKFKGEMAYCFDCENKILRLNAKLEGYKLAQKEILEKIDKWKENILNHNIIEEIHCTDVREDAMGEYFEEDVNQLKEEITLFSPKEDSEQ